MTEKNFTQTPTGNEDVVFTTVQANGESLPGGGTMTKHIAKGFFATRDNNLQRAIDDIKTTHITDQDGEYVGSWLLTEISYWNRDKEKIVVLCANTLLIVKFDFVAQAVKYMQRLQLSQIKKILSGKFQMPENSLMRERLYGGLRLVWGTMDDKPWYERWNPLNYEIPFTTFTSHPILSGNEDLINRSMFDVKSFEDEIAKWAKITGCSVETNQSIIIESYIGLASFVHNQSRLGFSRERGGVSF